MPNIRTFDTPALGLQPSEIGVESTAAAARRGGQFFNQAAQALTTTGERFGQDIKLAGKVATDYVDHQQIMTGAAHGTELFDALTKSKDQAIKSIDLQDPAYGQKVELAISQWRETQLNPALEKFREGFTTEGSQQWADHFINATRQHMFTSSAADVSNAAALGIKNAIHTSINTASNIVMRDPSALGSQLDMLEHSVKGMVASSPIKGVASAAIENEILEKGKEQLVKSAAIGAIQQSDNPEKTADTFATRWPKYITPEENKTLAANARQQIRARNYDYDRSRKLAKDEASDRSNEATNQYLIDVRSRDPRTKDDPLASKILNDPNLLKADKNNLLNYIDRQLKPETDARISSRTMAQTIMPRIGDPNSDPDETRKLLFAARNTDPGKPGSITQADFEHGMHWLEWSKTPEGSTFSRRENELFESLKRNPTNIMLDTYKMRFDLDQKIQEYRKAGKPIMSLLDPRSPDYIASPERLDDYKTSLQDNLHTAPQTGGKITGVDVVNIPPGMSPADAIKWLKDKNVTSGTPIRLPDGRAGTAP